MSESMVASFFMESLNVLFSHETDSLFRLEDAVQSLRTEMISFLSIIENEISYFETEFSEEIRRVVEKIRDVAYVSEDVIDELYVYKSLQQEAKLKVFQFINVAPKIRIIRIKICKCYNLAKDHVVFNSLSPSASVSGVESLQMQSLTELFMVDDSISNMEGAELVIEQLTGPELGNGVEKLKWTTAEDCLLP